MVEVTKEMITAMVYGSQDVQDVLCIKRTRLNALVQSGKLIPIKHLKNENLFFKPDVDELKKEMLKDSRTNLFKQVEGEKKNA